MQNKKGYLEYQIEQLRQQNASLTKKLHDPTGSEDSHTEDESSYTEDESQ